MKVFKFGGASVKDAEAVRNVATIINLYNDDLVVVVSAMGKTTNALERINEAYCNGNKEILNNELSGLKAYHSQVLGELFPNTSAPVYDKLATIFNSIESLLKINPAPNYDYNYDQIVSLGEIISTIIVSEFLTIREIENMWFDARQLVRTNFLYREGKVDWEISKTQIVNKVGAYLNLARAEKEAMKTEKEAEVLVAPKRKIAVVQGFIGATDTNQTTTLGREGSDYTAAIFAWSLDAENTTIWKDVPGVLNADPKWFDNTQKLDAISFKEAIELSYYGATIIHPKTIKPLQNKGIPLLVKSFINPLEAGTIIQESAEFDHLIPSFIFKMDQVLLSIYPKDFSFIVEENLSHIFELFSTYGTKINLMQNAAISFSVSIDNRKEKTKQLIAKLQETYHVKYNEDLELVTIRHYDEATIARVTTGKKVYVEQKSRHTARMVMK